jgi:hypothetical protein
MELLCPSTAKFRRTCQSVSPNLPKRGWVEFRLAYPTAHLVAAVAQIVVFSAEFTPFARRALALTFAYPVAKRDWAEERRFEEGLKRLRRWIV